MTDLPRFVVDTHVLVSALMIRSITGDRDLLVLNSFRDIPILTPRQFLQ